jgi:hypothetical protein
MKLIDSKSPTQLEKTLVPALKFLCWRVFGHVLFLGSNSPEGRVTVETSP